MHGLCISTPVKKQFLGVGDLYIISLASRVPIPWSRGRVENEVEIVEKTGCAALLPNNDRPRLQETLFQDREVIHRMLDQS